MLQGLVIKMSTSTHNTKFNIWDKHKGKVVLQLNTPIKISKSVGHKLSVILHLASGNVYLGYSESQLGTPTDGWLIPTGHSFPIYGSEELWAVTTDSAANLMVWEHYTT